MNAGQKSKKEMLKKWKETQKPEYILNETKAEELFEHLENQLETAPCDGTLRHTEQWLKENFKEKQDEIIEEIKEMGGYCDCEVVLNCYEEYDI